MGAGRMGALLVALALGCTLQTASSGQRFRLNSQQDKIEEARVEDVPVVDIRAAAKHGDRLRGQTVAAEPGDLDFYRGWFANNSKKGLVQRGSDSWFGEFPSPTALAVLMRKSIFSLSTTGKVYERFHNQIKWVYVKHENPSDEPLVALTAVRNRGTYFVSDSEGRLFQRLRVENGLGWMDVTGAEDHRIFLGGIPSTEGNVFFISEDGRLLERQFDQMGSNVGGMWSDHGKPNGKVKLVACVDAHTLSYGAVFVIGADGHLYNLETATNKWEDHGTASGRKLAPLQGVALEDLNAVGSLFLRTQDGRLVERWWDANSRKKRWMWIDHGHPTGAQIVSAPGALINGLSIFMTGTSGNLYERFWNSKEWVWIDHGNPSSPLMPVSPVDLHDGSVFTLLQNGKLGERVWHRNRWVWRSYDVPEGGSASYCTSDPLSRNNCVQGYSG